MKVLSILFVILLTSCASHTIYIQSLYVLEEKDVPDKKVWLKDLGYKVLEVETIPSWQGGGYIIRYKNPNATF